MANRFPVFVNFKAQGPPLNFSSEILENLVTSKLGTTTDGTTGLSDVFLLELMFPASYQQEAAY